VTPPPSRRQEFAAARRRAREVALQALYELEMAAAPLEAVLDERLREAEEDASLPAASRAFAARLIRGAWERRAAADALIAEAAPQWRVDQLPMVEHSLLRLAIYELCFDNETPPRAAINEAVELAKVFGGEHSGRFVNGVLGAIASKVDRGSDVRGRVEL
jgi:N utilization substance protein B